MCILLVISSLFASFSKNPVKSVLFLILSFCISAGILFLFGVDFLALLYIVVYVGAVAVLFLFVIMMLNVKANTEKRAFPLDLVDLISDINSLRGLNIETIFSIGLRIVVLMFFVVLYLTFISEISSFLETIYSKDISMYTVDKIGMIDPLYSIDVFGQVLYNYFGIYFLFGGIVLLIAMVGSIFVTLEFHKTASKSTK